MSTRNNINHWHLITGFGVLQLIGLLLFFHHIILARIVMNIGFIGYMVGIYYRAHFNKEKKELNHDPHNLSFSVIFRRTVNFSISTLVVGWGLAFLILNVFMYVIPH